MAYITAKIRADKVFHGYDDKLQLIASDLNAAEFVEKVIKIDRILSFTEKYIFIECPHNTVQTWEYEGGLQDIKSQLKTAGLLIA